MAPIVCHLTTEAKEALLEKLTASGQRVSTQRMRDVIAIEEKWLIGGMFSGAWIRFSWEAEKGTWYVWFGGRGLWTASVFARLFSTVQSTVEAYPGCSSHLKGKPPATLPDPPTEASPETPSEPPSEPPPEPPPEQLP